MERCQPRRALRLSHDLRLQRIFEPRARLGGTSLTTMRKTPSFLWYWLGASAFAATLGCANSETTTGSGSGGGRAARGGGRARGGAPPPGGAGARGGGPPRGGGAPPAAR